MLFGCVHASHLYSSAVLRPSPSHKISGKALLVVRNLYIYKYMLLSLEKGLVTHKTDISKSENQIEWFVVAVHAPHLYRCAVLLLLLEAAMGMHHVCTLNQSRIAAHPYGWECITNWKCEVRWFGSSRLASHHTNSEEL